MIINRIAFYIVLGVFLLTVGCVTNSAPYPLAGWQKDYGKVGQSIVNDYQSYIQNLSPEEQLYMGGTNFFEDDTGRHAVRIEVDIDGKDAWYHILFYDKDNKRIKAVKYFKGRYQS